MNYFRLLYELLYNGHSVSSRGQQTKELINVTLRLEKHNLFYTEQCRTFEKVWLYLSHELAWYLSGNRDISYIVKYAKMWGEICNEDKTANSNYGNLVFYKTRGCLTSFDWALQNFMQDKFTRKSIVTYNDGTFNYLDNKDYICSQQQHFLIRENKLICMIYLRSSDAIFGLSYNMPWWSIVQQNLMIHLRNKYKNLQLGDIIVHIGSSHIYSRHYALVENMLKDKLCARYLMLKKPIELGHDEEYYYKEMENYFQIT